MCPSSRKDHQAHSYLETSSCHYWSRPLLPIQKKVVKAKQGLSCRLSATDNIGQPLSLSAEFPGCENPGITGWLGLEETLNIYFQPPRWNPVPVKTAGNFAVVFRGTWISLQVFTRLWSCLSERTCLLLCKWNIHASDIYPAALSNWSKCWKQHRWLRGLSDFSLLIKV